MDRLRQRADFLAVANGARAASAAFVVQARRRDDDGPIRVGFTVTRKNGTATERNRIRRRLRELVKRLDYTISMRPHSDYVLVGRRAALTCDFATMLDDLRSALQRLDRQPKNVVTGPSNKAFSNDSLPQTRSGADHGSRNENAFNKAATPAANRTE
jgi:ribonuclease P protein component